jgi:DNA-directed RNA polymerase subunit M/transcription elongation factor TFIIS
MTSTFLHEDKNIPPDETIERDAPECPVCRERMKLAFVRNQSSDTGTESTREYECIRCGRRQFNRTVTDQINPLTG